MIKVLFVCLGNICRSPTAHAVLQQMVGQQGLQDKIVVDSCGTGSWHIGNPPDKRMQQVALQHGYDLSGLHARKLTAEDFDTYDYILGMDTRNVADILKKMPAHYSGKVALLLDYSSDKNVLEVPDPYYGGEEGFERVLHLIEMACTGLLSELSYSRTPRSSTSPD